MTQLRVNVTPGPLGRACGRRLPLAQPWRSGLGLQRAQATAAQRLPRAAAASSDSDSQGDPPAALFSSPRLEQRQQEWQARLEQVAAFQQQHSWVPRQRPSPGRPLVEGEAELGCWCAQQRRRKHGSWGEPLSAQEAAALRAIPGWIWAPPQGRGRNVEWEQRLVDVASFQQQRGRLPRHMAGKAEPLVEGEQRLGEWCNRQRQRFKGQGNGAPLTAAQIAGLEALPGWFWEQFRCESWEQRLDQVAAFVAQHGRLPRTEGGKAEPMLPGEQRLGEWCHKQRQRFKGQAGTGPLTPEQAAALEALRGWEWGKSQEQQPWEARLAQVAAFVARHGRLPRVGAGTAKPTSEGEQQLGEWCHKQRQRYKGQGTRAPLAPEQVVELEALPGWVWEEHQPWEAWLLQLAAFVEQHGRLPRGKDSKAVPLAEGEGALGHWVARQRQRKKGQARGRPLTGEQVAALEAYPWWRW